MTADDNKHVLVEGFYTRARRLHRHVTSVGMLGGRRGVRQTRTFFGSDSFLRAAWLVLVERKRKKDRKSCLRSVCDVLPAASAELQAVCGIVIPPSQRATRASSEVDGPLRVFVHYDGLKANSPGTHMGTSACTRRHSYHPTKKH